METFADIIGLWDRIEDFASDTGVSVYAARKWKSRNKIPGEYWAATAEAADRRGFDGVTLDVLAHLGARAVAA